MNHRFARLLIFVFLISPLFASSQGEFNNWYFGQKAGLDFNSGSPVALLNSAMWTGYSSVSVSDSAGQLLFYSDGFRAFNRHHILMPNGLSLNGLGWQPVFSIKDIQNDSLYFIFTGGYHDNGNYTLPYYGLGYSVLDMTMNGGLGDIDPTQKSVRIYGAHNASNALTGTRHQNNKYAWIVSRLRDSDSNYYVSYLVNNNGLDTIPVLSPSIIKLNMTDSVDCREMKISRDGTKLACCYVRYNNPDSNFIEFCSFNSLTGSITPRFLITPTQGGYSPYSPESVEFSVDGKYLYVSALTHSIPGVVRSFIFQYDATKTDSAQFKQSETVITMCKESSLQLASDWKIYASIFIVPYVDSLSRINNPSVPGSGCNFELNAVSLNGKMSGLGLVQFLQKYKAYIHHSPLCQDDSVHFYGDIWPPPDSIHWDFGDPASGPANFSNLPNPSHIYSITGNYTVELFVRHNDNRTDTSWQTITIISSPQVALGADRTICQGDSTTFDAGACVGCSYVWKDIGSGLTVGTARTFRTGQPGDYSVTVTNSNGCYGSDTVHLFTTPVPSVTNNPLFKSICSGESTNIPLTSNVAGTMFHWTATLTTGNINGFSADSGLVINQVLVNSLATAGTVTYHITPKVGSCSGATVDFPVTVNPGDSVKVSISASANNICAGTSVTFTTIPTNGGTTPSYLWKVNGISVGTNNPNYTYNPASGDLVSCILTSSISVCISNNPATSNTIQMIVNPLNPVSVSISPSANPVCAGTTVIFTATPTNGGTSPSYQWKVNGTNVGTNSPTYSYNPASGDLASCIMTSNILCPSGNPATSNTIIMTVNPNLPVSVSISASANPFCQGSPVTFTAAAINGGPAPFYQWRVNGVNVGTNSPTYAYNPASGDLVSCILTSNIACPTGNPATSNSISMIVNANLPAGINITASTNPFCPGNSVTFTAIPVNGGTIPSFQWKVNGVNTGTNSSIFTYNPASGDLVSCIMTSSLACVTGNPATSNTIIMSGTLAPFVTLTLCNDTITTTNAKPFKLKGGIPPGGTYSGAGVAGGIFNPATAGAGNHQITYSYTNAALCTANASVTIVTIVAPVTTCGQNLTDIRDNKNYHTVQIGSQCWMAKDLDYGFTIDEFTNQRDNCIPEKYIRNPSSVIRNSLYQWDELMQYDETVSNQGLCPPGWHVPSESDWNTLFAFYTNSGFAGSPLKYSGFSGFNALLSGTRHLNKTWDYQGFATFFWSSTPHGVSKAFAHGMNDIDPSVSLYPAFRNNAFSVRCLKDN
jgi:uncharacterized protein (TIGR02145 family)